MNSSTDPRVEIDPPDIAVHAVGNSGIPYIHVLTGDRDGPTAMISAVVHGNEFCGAIVVDELLRNGFRPLRGRLIVAFMNVMALQRFDAADPGASRYVDEDFNRVWSAARLDGPADSSELRRARAVRPILHEVDFLLDLHSTSTRSNPMILTGTSPRALAFAQDLGCTAAIVCDSGHNEGRRMRDYDPFSGDGSVGPTSLLIECGQHWLSDTVDYAREATDRFLTSLGMKAGASPKARTQDILEVTDAITVMTDAFRFLEDFQGLERIRSKGTEIAYDGARPIVTPYDDCVLIMPTAGSRSGQTAVRLARRVGVGGA